MKKLLLLLFSLILVFTVPASLQATLFTFGPISDAGGTGTATMDINIVGNTLSAELRNTSPITLDGGTGVNSPGVTAFGFDLDPDTLSLSSWELTAYSVSGSNDVGNLVTIGSSAVGTWDWLLTIGGNTNGIKVDYVPNTVQAVQGALYNPEIATGEAALPNYYTEAILTLIFNEQPFLNITDDDSPIVRMQNVGDGGFGSLKLPGTIDGGGGGTGDPVPEPGTLVLLGCGLLGLAGVARKKRSQ